ncbi:MAG: flagellar assembly protein FliW [Clostridiales bacterium]|jgi:flagellar assembly factor FliW|nr:flagellar assembly protein FliW [Clostridiales bacterium]
MVINTKSFGEVDVQEDKVINFEPSIPGFPDSKRYMLMYESDNPDENIFCWLQSVDQPEIAFAVLDSGKVFKDYSPVIEDSELGELKHTNEEDLLLYNIVVIPDDVENLSANLKAPVLIDSKRRIGKQVIANNDDYQVRHYIIEELRSRNG